MSTPAHTQAALDFTEEFATAAEWFAVTVASVDLRTPVPTCPGWSIYDLVTHVGNTHAWAATVVETRLEAPEQNDEPAHRKAKSASEWYAGKAEDLYEVLRHAKPDEACWNFAFGEGRAAFWPRRQLHETTMHGVDLALAAGRIPDLRRDISADGIDEILRVFLHRMHMRGHPADLDVPMTVVARDADQEWTVHPGSPPHVVDGSSDGSDRIEGPAAALYALLWKRLPSTDSSLTFVGDQARINAFLGSRLTA